MSVPSELLPCTTAADEVVAGIPVSPPDPEPPEQAARTIATAIDVKTKGRLSIVLSVSMCME
jgi:hypothetical protein